MTPKLFSELGLSAEILKAIDKLGFEKAAPIQAEAIPVLMSGRDVVGQSQTGSGKTAAFAIPAIEKTDPNLKARPGFDSLPDARTRRAGGRGISQAHALQARHHALPIYGGQSYERQFFRA
jgi:ATP-dependent RNA helicase DeaD